MSGRRLREPVHIATPTSLKRADAAFTDIGTKHENVPQSASVSQASGERYGPPGRGYEGAAPSMA